MMHDMLLLLLIFRFDRTICLHILGIVVHYKSLKYPLQYMFVSHTTSLAFRVQAHIRILSHAVTSFGTSSTRENGIEGVGCSQFFSSYRHHGSESIM
jgi:hypothetical protein